MKYCENCGAKLEEDSVFCEECGTKVEEDQTSENVEETRTPSDTSKKAERKPLTKQQKIITGGVVGVVLLLLAGYGIGSVVYSEENQVERMTEALSSTDANDIAGVVTTNDPEFEVNAENLEGFATYLEENPNYLRTLTSELENVGHYDQFSIEQDGKTFGIFDSYELVMTPVYGEISILQEDVIVYANDEEILTTTSNQHEEQVGPFAPGIITFTAEGNEEDIIDGELITVTEEVEWINDSTTNEQVSLAVNGTYFSVSSDLETATVYIDGESVGELEDGTGEFGPVQVEDGMEVHVAQSFDDGEIASEPEELVEGSSVYYEFYDLAKNTEEDASNIILGMYREANRLSSNYGDEDDFNDYFHPEGPANEELRTSILSDIESASNHDDITSLDFDAEIDEVERVGVNTFVVSYEVSQYTRYNFFVDRDDGLEHHAVDAVVVFEPTTHPDRDFDGYLYEIQGTELLYEENQDGASASTTEQDDDDSSSEEESSDDSDDDSDNGDEGDLASSTVNGFVTNLPAAVNDNNFSEIVSYMDPSSSFHGEQEAFVENTYERGITEELDSLDITGVTINDDGSATVTTTEAFTVFNDGSESTSQYNAEYTLEKINGDYLITSLEIN